MRDFEAFVEARRRVIETFPALPDLDGRITDLPLGVDILYQARDKYPFRDMQTLFPFTIEGVKDAVAQAMAMKTVKSTIVPFDHLVV